MRLLYLLCALVLPLCVPSWSTEISVASFNIRIYSTGSREDTELGLIADRLQQFDLIAIQELWDEEVVRRTLDILAARGLEYRALVNGAVGRGSLERYAAGTRLILSDAVLAELSQARRTYRLSQQETD